MQQIHPKIVIRLSSSKRLGLFVAAVHCAALAALLWCALYQPLVLFLLAPLGASLVWNWREQVSRRGAVSVQQVEALADGSWRLTDRRGRVFAARLAQENFVAPWMTLLTFRCGRFRNRHILLLSDNSDPDAVRRLRVRLRSAR